MERIVAERDQAIKDHPPNVAAEIEPKRPQPVTEAREGESGAGQWAQIAADPTFSPEAAHAARQAERSSQAAMKLGEKALGWQLQLGAAESNKRAVHAGESAGNAFAPVTAPIWQRPESGLTDRAGNIVLRNLNPENFGQALVESAERSGDFKAVRGDMTKGQMWDLATELGLNLEDVNLEDRLARIVGKFNDLAPVALALRRLTREFCQERLADCLHRSEVAIRR